MNQQSHAFLLHLRKYTDSRVILKLFTAEHGVVDGVYRLPSRKKSIVNSPQAFVLYHISWTGNGALKKIVSLEPNGKEFRLQGKRLFCGMYLNELLQKLGCDAESAHALFNGYVNTLIQLCEKDSLFTEIEVSLRRFELGYMESLGFGIDFSCDNAGNIILNSEDKTYVYQVEQGFTLIDLDENNRFPKHAILIKGSVIAQLGGLDFSENHVRDKAKQICRLAIQNLLGEKTLKSRELFQQ